TINSSTGVISGTASADRSPTSVTVTATDGGSLFATQSFNLGVVSAPTITGLAADVAVANSGDELTFTATVSEAVTVNTSGGTPTLTLDVGGQTLTATYSGGSGTTSLTFTATAGAGDDSTVTVTAINLNGGTITGNTTAQGLLTTATGQVVASFIVDNTNPSFTSGTATNFVENGSGVAYASAVTDATAVTYTLGGTDAALFNVDSSTGAVTFKAAPNFEAPADSGTDNVYNITVTASDAAGNQSSQSVAITVTNVNEAPTLTSAGTASFAENGAGTVYTATATDPDAGTSLTYSLGGSDADLFDIDASTGVVTFKAAPNFEVPADAGGNNVYDITVTATDNGTGTLSDTKAVAITVTDVNEAPVIGSGATGSVAENAATSTVIYTAQASDVDAGTVLTYSLSGADASLLDINASTGAVTLKASANFEVKSSYSFNVIATDNGTGALSDTEAVIVSVTDVNEAPTAVGTVAAQTAVNGQAFSLDVQGYFADVDAGSNGALTYSATGLPSGITINSSTGVISGTASADRSPTSVTVTATDGGSLFATQSFNLGVASAPVLQSSALDNVTNLDVTSAIVLNYDQAITAVEGKYIHIINDGGTGFRGESSVNNLDILVTDSTQVSIVNGVVTLNPAFDLDLANNYHIKIDAGAFIATSTGLETSAFDGTTSLNFSTVTPGTLSVANAVASQKMDATGTMVASYSWLDIEGISSPSAGSGTTLDLSGGNYALLAKDYDASGGDADMGYDGVQLGNLYVAAINFSLGDLIYIDDQGNNPSAPNDLSLTGVLDTGTPPTMIQFAGTDLGGFIEVSISGSSVMTFDSVDAFNSAIGGTAVLTA
ncbi:hypothetical protein FJY94_07880, partial [Candidatus Kaiserbacteria bacterium]|nr:hypothetical protein [Candidatus Kaiserbacteria bacterium]